MKTRQSGIDFGNVIAFSGKRTEKVNGEFLKRVSKRGAEKIGEGGEGKAFSNHPVKSNFSTLVKQVSTNYLKKVKLGVVLN